MNVEHPEIASGSAVGATNTGFRHGDTFAASVALTGAHPVIVTVAAVMCDAAHAHARAGSKASTSTWAAAGPMRRLRWVQIARAIYDAGLLRIPDSTGYVGRHRGES